ncbi:hypothetical protein QE152_g33290 [Popillia japonica]|uniref:Nicotinamide riboside kinase 1 n=1 Tax=Popillia japonica TaxID=7064 RepID=A0AAW1IXK9_POPJA
MSVKWLIIGISGATCGGKTTLANKLKELFPSSVIINQDAYFLPVDDDRHVWIPELNHINFDTLTSLDMNKMYDDIMGIIADSTCTMKSLSKPKETEDLTSIELQTRIQDLLNEKNVNILIADGFCIYYHKPIEKLCNLKYFATLNRDECYKRRTMRVYEPPDCPGYFEHCVWPEYLRQLEDVQNNVENVHYFSEFTEDPVKIVLDDLAQVLECVE